MRMRRCPFPIAALIALCCSVTPVAAEEQYIEFLEGLRRDGYYDASGWYLDQLETRGDLPEEIRIRLPYERAITLIQSARQLRSPEAQEDQLDQAQKHLNAFINQTDKNHPLFASANSETAQIYLGKARVAVFMSQDPSNAADKERLRADAREHIKKARAIYKTAYESHKFNYEKFPKYIDKSAEREQYEDRDQAQDSMIRAQIQLALCTYEEARTYDEGSTEYKSGLTKAAEEFEKIYVQNRRSIAGLLARVWQGKCFEEQNEIGKALGFYKETLDHEGTHPGLLGLQRKAKHFRLICLNHEGRNDHALVVKEAREWLRDNRRYAATDDGLGIRYQLVRALVKQSEDRSLPESEREELLRDARDECERLHAYAGRYKAKSGLLLAEIRFRLTGNREDPETFDDARIASQTLFQALNPKLTSLESAKAENRPQEEIDKLQSEVDSEAAETIRLTRLALELADESTDTEQLNKVRYQLAYVYYMQGREYEAAVIGEYLGRRFKDEDLHRQSALDGAFLAMSAYFKAASKQSDPRQREADMQAAARVCELIIVNWPEGDRTMQAMRKLGAVYMELGKPEKAVEWYSRVPKGVPQYAAAQSEIGKLYWNTHLQWLQLPKSQRPPADKIDEWRNKAPEFMRKGLKALEKPTSPRERAQLIAHRVALVQMLNSLGKYQEAVTVLTEEPNPVVEAIQVEDESKRPDAPDYRSRAFAIEALSALVRAYIGIGETESAQDTMTMLENIAGAEDRSQVNAVYVALGRALQKEMEQLKRAGKQEQAAGVRESVEAFLENLVDNEVQQFNTLAWVGETYYGLAEGSEDDPVAARELYDKAQDAFQQILDRAATDADFVDPRNLLAVKAKMAACRRRSGDWEGALDMAVEVLREHENDPSVQIEAARIYKDWGLSGEPDAHKKLKAAIEGTTRDGAKIWGWAQLGRKIQGQVSRGGGEKYRDRLYDVWYEATYCRQQYAQSLSKSAERKKELKEAARSMRALVAVSGRMPEPVWERFDDLYRDILRDAGEPVESLPRPVAAPPPATTEVAMSGDGQGDEEPTDEEEKETAPDDTRDEKGPHLGLVIAVVVLLGGAAVVGVFFMGKRDTRRRVAYEHLSVPEELPAFAAAGTERRQRRKKTRPSAQQRGSTSQKQKRPKPGGDSGGASG